MAVFPVIVGIATRERLDLLERTLESLSRCRRPPAFAEAVVVENGGRRSAESLVRNIAEDFPVTYRTIEEAGKNRALNEVVAAYPEAFVVFLDDDVRLDEGLLVAYAEAAARTGRGVFFGGRCGVDYEKPPEDWLKPFLPLSAKGWFPGSDPCEIQEALGFNWGAFAQDILMAGGFPLERGPGKPHSIGDETEMQERLIRAGVRGQYLPEAVAWHYVPPERCCEDWVIQRAHQQGIASGLRLRSLPEERRVRMARAFRLKAAAFSILLRTAARVISHRRRFSYRRNRQYLLGVTLGLRGDFLPVSEPDGND